MFDVFALPTARIELGTSFTGFTMTLVVGGLNFGDQVRLPLQAKQAIDLMCADLSDEQKSFYIADLGVREVPKGYERILASIYPGFIHTIYQTRDEAAKALIEMFEREIEDAKKMLKGTGAT